MAQLRSTYICTKPLNSTKGGPCGRKEDQYVFCMRLALKIKQKRRFVGLEPAVIGRKKWSGGVYKVPK